jgi:hypothetical protein
VTVENAGKQRFPVPCCEMTESSQKMRRATCCGYSAVKTAAAAA